MIYQIQWQRRDALKQNGDPLISTMVSIVGMGTQSMYKMNIWY